MVTTTDNSKSEAPDFLLPNFIPLETCPIFGVLFGPFRNFSKKRFDFATFCTTFAG
jgi:hypothetical protein